ncbi:transglycosylase domain-containing protein [Corynebacterium lowii]|uniref:transglycosylase domain-containing protein n=1 Tax=Corynebacterium lowii TaxID=1544413 RepID=UPI0006DCA569|nr:transglycosylase domain-containing protein [Corynebacterium lowii]MDP9852197.1 membrane peptidoglycan carboxypeptidase [Corynebacterium lowii]
MSIAKSLTTILSTTVSIGVVSAIALSPAAGVAGIAVQRTSSTMESNLADLTDGHAPGVTTITDVTGEPMAWIYDQRRYEVPSEGISQSMKDAIVAIEDRRFYEHEGVDMQGTMRALVTNLTSGGVSQGASTLNQQYVKNYLLFVAADDDAERSAATETSIPRKLREMRMASDLDKLLTKDEVLTRYLNLVPFGNNSFGVEAAARTYFGISAAELTVPQAAMLAGIVQSSSVLDPYSNPEGVTARRNTVLDAMVSYGALDAAQAEQYKLRPLGVQEQPESLPNGCITAGDRGFMCDYALNYLEAKGLPKDVLTKGGYTIRTTLDPQVQDAARNTVTANVNPGTPGVAEVLNVVRPGEDSRDILAMTSSRNYGLDPENGETLMPQPTSMVGNGAGSVFKVFTAAAAINNGMGLETMLNVPERFEAVGMGEGGAENCPAMTYCVENAGTYAPQMTLKDALAQSPNTTFVELIQQVGVAPVVDLAVGLGLRSYAVPGSFDGEASIADYMKDHNLGSFTLGPTAVNALELSNVGASIASGGRWCEPNPIASITDSDGNEIPLERPECEDVLDTQTANALMHGLSEDAVSGTASRAAQAVGWGSPVAAKTGTTESHMSSAFLGFNSNIAAAPYIYNDGTQNLPLCSGPVQQCGTGNLFGGNEPADTWFQWANAVPQAVGGYLPDYNRDLDRGRLQSALDEATGKNENEARALLEEAGLTVNTQSVPGEGTPRGIVRAARTENPEGLRPGSLVTLDVSDGSRPTRQPEPTSQAPTASVTPQTSERPALPTVDTSDLEELTNRLRERLGQL